MTIVTPNEIAKTLGVSGLAFRNWLRAEKSQGNAILAGHQHGQRYRFRSAEAAELKAGYVSSASQVRSRSKASPGGSGTQAASAPRRRVSPTRTSKRSSPSTFSVAALKRAGFTGWLSWQELRSTGCAAVPTDPGVYVVYRPSADVPRFRRVSPAGRFKGRDPSVPVARLSHEWVDGASVLYIGKADQPGGGGPALRRRLGDYARFGAGDPIGHWGGRLVWQIEDSDDLLVAWCTTGAAGAAREYERDLLRRFAALHDGRRPFANLTG